MAVGYVYLMTNGSDYKIGLTSSDPKDRKKQLQTGSSEQINLIAYTICSDMNSLENKLHNKFSSKRRLGEWFALNDDDLYNIYSIFKQKSINLGLSFIPEFITNDIDKLMSIDGKRLAVGDDTLYDNKYTDIPNYKEIVLAYMERELGRIEQENKEEEERIRKEEEEEINLEELIKIDARRIVDKKKPLHTFEYKKLKDWRIILRSKEYEIRQEAEETEEEIRKEVEQAEEYLKKDAKRILVNLDPTYGVYYTHIFEDWEERLTTVSNILKNEKLKEQKNPEYSSGSQENKELSKKILEDKRRIERDKNIYLITVLEREKNSIKPPVYEVYFKGSFEAELHQNRHSSKARSILANLISSTNNAETYLGRIIGQKEASLLRKQTSDLYDKYLLYNQSIPFDRIPRVAATNHKNESTTILTRIKKYMGM